MYRDLEINLKNVKYATFINNNTKEITCALVVNGLLGYQDIKTGHEYTRYFISGKERWIKSKNMEKELNYYSLVSLISFKDIINEDGIFTVEEILRMNEKVNELLNSNEIYKFTVCKGTEKTFAIIKPDGMENIEKIIEMIYASGLKIEKYEIRQLDEKILEEHYSHLVDKPYYPTLKNYMMSSPVALMILEGANAVEILRKLIGPTDSTKADKDTIRGRFGTNIQKNAIHASDSKENAEIEIERFFKEKQNKKI